MDFSIIIPVYNRPEELHELLLSLAKQTYKNFEVIVVDDGSELRSEEVIKTFSEEFTISYHWKENSGPAQTRNYAVPRSNTSYVIFFDSDCVIPRYYMEIVTEYVELHNIDAFGGPDKAKESFTPLQKAINYSMTSFLTTGGIRGGKKQVDTYYPRTFNMGVSKKAFTQIRGFSDMRYGEDVDFSMRLHEQNFKVELIQEAYVYHKRRTDISSFYNQVFNFGRARYNLTVRHPGSLKPVHLLPSAFALYVICTVILTPFLPMLWAPLLLIVLVFFLDSLRSKRNLWVAVLSSITSFVQLFGYGIGLIWETVTKSLLKESG
ncbi:MAG: glycosyltransferase [Balneolaceae bacterium]|nr:glycosyltransferase [Balneolaceae bacterium]